ncbi:Membrane-bound transcription factor site-2 protease, partial [Trichostrongylus colubriformis]
YESITQQLLTVDCSAVRLRIYTTRYNEGSGSYLPASKEVPVSRKLKSLWFTLGAVAALVCLAGITVYLSHLIYRDASYLLSLRPNVTPYRSIAQTTVAQTTLESKTVDDLPPPPTDEYDVLDASGGSETGLVPIIPGVNLPWSHIPIFVIVLAVAAIVHEIGHSAAATTYNVRVNGFGIFLLGLYPGAFTDIDPESLKRSHPRHRLEVFGGGIWHNLVLAGIAYLMFLTTPYVLSPFFGQGQGVTVTGVDSRSGLYGAGGLTVGNVVVSIDDCPVRKHEDWRECVRRLEKNKHGQCVPRTAVEASLATKTSMSLDELHCCEDFANITHAHMCFESMLDMTTKHLVTKAPSLNRVLRVGIVEPAEEIVRKRRKKLRRFSCLSAQYVTSQPTCSNSSSCAMGGDGEERVCVFPALFNGTQLARISVKNHVRPVLYVGNLDELISYVSIDGLVTRFSWIPHYWAESVELIPKYLFTLSLALGLLNSVPCYALDGQYIVIVCVNWYCKALSRRRRHQLITLILSVGTLLLAVNVLIGFVKMVV